MTILKNRTPHVIALQRSGSIEVIEPCGKPARVRSDLSFNPAPDLDIEIWDQAKDLTIVNLPPATPGEYVIVSQIVALVACRLYPDRRDILFPASSKYHGAEKDESGVVSVSRFIRAS